jgi:hypothetical protein
MYVIIMGHELLKYSLIPEFRVLRDTVVIGFWSMDCLSRLVDNT